MPITSADFGFDIDGQLFDGYVCWDDEIEGARPGILVAPTYAGLTDFEKGKASELAAAGYVGFAIDLYGRGRQRTTSADLFKLMDELETDRPLLASRINHALDALKLHPMVTASRTGAIGFCFGGKCVLDLARSGAETRGVVSLHGVFDPPPTNDSEERPVVASILVLHGYDDPMSPPQSLAQLSEELKRTAEDWEVIAYGGTLHSFTNPAASAPERGVQYHQRSNQRAWTRMLDFLKEVTR